MVSTTVLWLEQEERRLLAATPYANERVRQHAACLEDARASLEGLIAQATDIDKAITILKESTHE